jgi:hypothetical protein
VLISDLIGDDDAMAWDAILPPLGRRACLIHPVCAADLEPPFEGGFTLVEAESVRTASLTIDSQVTRAYRHAYDNYYEQVKRYAERSGCRFTVIHCEERLEQHLNRLAPDGVLRL